MSYRIAIAFALMLSADADLPRLTPLRAPDRATPESFPAGDSIPLFPMLTGDSPQEASSAANMAKRGTTLQETSKLALIRYVSGEFAKARKPLPGGKDGVTLYVDKPVDQQFLDKAVASHGAAVNTGDNAQITRLEFREHTIVVDVNGGGNPKKSWRDHIQFGMGGAGPASQPTTTATNENQGPPGLAPGAGGTIFVQFPKNVPDLTPDDLKRILEPFLDFSKERSASVHWIDTLPPEMKKAITDRRPALGMDREEVVAAIGKPDRKVRERDANGYDTEDWIYGHPPDKTIFVRFIGERVTAIKQYPQ
jgi:sulfur carrier protein ThiS